MMHGIVLGGGAMMALSAMLFSLWSTRAAEFPDAVTDRQSRHLGWLTVAAAGALWLTVIVGTYVSFPDYRATPPAGLVDLARYPRSLIQSSPDTMWLHSFAMEIKEHVPWIAAMLATAVAFVALRYRSTLLRDAGLRRMATALVAICLALVGVVSMLGVFVNKVAPLE
jgi:heme A synthase